MCAAPRTLCRASQLAVTEAGVEIGGAVTLTRMMRFFKGLIASRPAYETSGLRAVVNQLR
jgi:xanthine dehydrogenase/oxidase